MPHLAEISKAFLKLGFTAFGGPAAHISMMEQEFVNKRKWVSPQNFLDMIATINCIPGPNSTQLAIYLGYIRGGYAGLFAAGACFIVPAMLIILSIAYLYVQYGTLPKVHDTFLAINAAVIAVAVVAISRLGRTAIHDRFSTAIAIITLLLSSLKIPAVFNWLTLYVPSLDLPVRLFQYDLVLMFSSAIIGAIWYHKPSPKNAVTLKSIAVPAMLGSAMSSKFVTLILAFLKIGATLFGSGYLLLTYLQTDFVDRYHWLTHQQLLDAISVGQFTPGPLLTTATFIGYLLGHQKFIDDANSPLPTHILCGITGGMMATVAIFLPSFFLIMLVAPLLQKYKDHPLMRGALNATNACVLSLILLTILRMAFVSLVNPFFIAIAVITFLLTVRKWNSTYVIILAAISGLCRSGMLH